MPMYGRAAGLYPRSLELLDSLGVLDEMLQEGYIGRMSITHKNGQRVTTRGWHGIWTQMHNTELDYMLNLRMKHSEDIFRKAYLKLGGLEAAGWRVVNLVLESNGVSPVTVEAQQVSTEKRHVVKWYVAGKTSELIHF